jgi:outer membrane autotransporter protein
MFGQRFAGVLANQFAGRASALRAGAAGLAVSSSKFDLPGSTASAAASGLVEAARSNQLAAADGGSGWFFPPGSPLAGFVSGQLVVGDRTYAPNQNGQNFTTGGFTVGVDYRLNPSSAIGLAGSYFTGEVNIADGTTDARGGAGSLYGTTEFGPVYFDAFVGGGFTGYDTRRNIGLNGFRATATGSPSGSFVAAAANAGYRFENRSNQGVMRWGPVADVRFNNVSIDAYAESGAGLLSTQIRGRDATSVQTGVGGEWAFDMSTPGGGTVTPHFRVTWQHEFADITETAIASFIAAPGAPFTLTSSRLGRDFAALSAGISGVVSPGVRLSVDYTGEVGQTNQNVHQFSLSARIAF